MDQTKKDYQVKILAFEGPDKVGKSSLICEINRRTDYEYLCIDRFTGSAWVYDILSGRRMRQEELETTERELARLQRTKIINIILNCSEDVLRERILDQEGEDAIGRISLLDKAIKLYAEYARHVSVFPVIEIDTSDKSIDATAEEILRKVSEL
jgi:thymidylate kinase